MDAISALTPPSVSSDALDQAEKLVAALVEACEADSGQEDPPELAELRELTGRNDIQFVEFYHLYSAMEDREFAHQLMLPKAAKIADLSEDVLVEIYRKVDEFIIKPELHYYLDLLRVNVGEYAVGLVFDFPSEDWINHLVITSELEHVVKPSEFAPTPEQRAREALRKPPNVICL